MYNHVLFQIKTITPSGEGQSGQTYVASAMTSDEDVSRSMSLNAGMPQLPQSASPSLNTDVISVTSLSPTPTSSRPQRQSGAKKPKVEDVLTQCDQCSGPGSKENLVR